MNSASQAKRPPHFGVLMLAVMFLLRWSSPAFLVAASIWDESFEVLLTRAVGVSKLALQPDGRIVIVGGFSEVEGVPRRGIARLLPDGFLDRGFDPGAFLNASPILVAVQPDGKILVGGLTGASRFIIKRFGPDGVLDSSFDLLGGIEPSWYSGLTSFDMLLLRDGKILVGGHFSRVQGQTLNCLARFNSDGSLDSSFNPNSHFGHFDTVTHLYLRNNGDIFFTAVYDSEIITRFGFGRLMADGSVDPTISLNTGGWARVDTISFASGDRLVLFGEFYGLDGDQPRYALRLNPDNSVDRAFSLPLSFWPAATEPLVDGRTLLINVGAPAMLLKANGHLDTNFTDHGHLAAGKAVLQPDGRIVSTGSGATLTNGLSDFGVIRLFGSGASDPSFSMPGGVMAACGGLQGLVVQPDGRVLFRSDDAAFANGQRINPPLTRFLTNGEIDRSFVYSGPALFGETPLEAQRNGKLLLGTSDRVFRLKSTGELDTNFNHWMVCETAEALVKLADGGTLVQSAVSTLTGCSIVQWNVVTIRRVGADGRSEPGFSPVMPDPSSRECWEDPVDGTVCWQVYSGIRHIIPCRTDGAFYVAGRFNWLSGVGRTNVARILTDGRVDPSFQPELTAPVAGIGLLTNDNIAVLTEDAVLSVFDVTGSIHSRARLQGGMPSGLRSVWFARDGTFVLGSSSNGENTWILRRFELNGTLAGNCRIAADSNLFRGVMQPDGKLVVSALFFRADGTSWSGIRRLNSEALQGFRLRVLPSSGNALNLQMEGPLGWRFVIQRSSDFSNWESLPTQLTTTAPGNRIEIPTLGKCEFFRAVASE